MGKIIVYIIILFPIIVTYFIVKSFTELTMIWNILVSIGLNIYFLGVYIVGIKSSIFFLLRILPAIITFFILKDIMEFNVYLNLIVSLLIGKFFNYFIKMFKKKKYFSIIKKFFDYIFWILPSIIVFITFKFLTDLSIVWNVLVSISLGIFFFIAVFNLKKLFYFLLRLLSSIIVFLSINYFEIINIYLNIGISLTLGILINYIIISHRKKYLILKKERQTKQSIIANFDEIREYGKTIFFLQEGDYNKGIEHLKKMSEFGSKKAQNKLGDMYLTGDGVVANEKEAEKYYKMADE